MCISWRIFGFKSTTRISKEKANNILILNCITSFKYWINLGSKHLYFQNRETCGSIKRVFVRHHECFIHHFSICMTLFSAFTISGLNKAARWATYSLYEDLTIWNLYLDDVSKFTLKVCVMAVLRFLGTNNVFCKSTRYFYRVQ